MRSEQARALARAAEEARRAGADAILLAGDVWDAGSASVAEVREQLEALAAWGGPVLVSPGRSDGAERLPFGDEEFRRAVGLGSWPPNVHLFRGPAWESFAIPGRDDAVVVARAWDGSGVPDPREAPAPISVLLASLPEGAAPVPAGWAWGAFGGRAAAEVRDGDGLHGAFAGAPVPSSFEENDATFLVVRLLPGRAPELSRGGSSGLRFLDLTLAVDGLEDAAFRQRAARCMEEAGAGMRDAVRLTLTGTPAPGARLAPGALGSGVLHLALRDRTERPSAGEAPGTAEGRFAEEMRARIGAAKGEHERRTARRALELGRAALAGRPIVPTGREDA